MSAPSDARVEPAKDPKEELLTGQRLVRFHLSTGWWSLLVFLTLGLVLEGLHGFKVDWYLNVSRETRRLMWTLAHAHGTLLSLIHLVFAATLSLTPGWVASSRKLASRCLFASGLLLPAGFFLGGFGIQGGDPSIGILLVPVGGLLLFVAVFLTATGLRTDRAAIDPQSRFADGEK